MRNGTAIQDVLLTVCNAVLELHGPAQESDEARRPMITDKKEKVGMPCDNVGECVKSKDVAIRSIFGGPSLQHQPQQRPQ